MDTVALKFCNRCLLSKPNSYEKLFLGLGLAAMVMVYNSNQPTQVRVTIIALIVIGYLVISL